MIAYGRSGSQENPFDCIVDGAAADIILYSWGFVCSWKGEETDSPHKLLLNPARDPNGLFQLESVWYLPSPKALPTLGHGEWAVYQHDDPDFDRGGTWGALTHQGESAAIATQFGSWASLRFQGMGAFPGWVTKCAQHICRYQSYMGRPESRGGFGIQ
jgi:hypothetical protein